MNVSLLNAWCSVKHSTNKSAINIKTNTTGTSSIGFIKTHNLNVSKLAELSLFRHSFKKKGGGRHNVFTWPLHIIQLRESTSQQCRISVFCVILSSLTRILFHAKKSSEHNSEETHFILSNRYIYIPF